MGQFSPTMNTVSLVLSGLVCLCQGSPIQIQTFLVETNTSVLCRQGVCISEDPHKQKCPEDFFEDECPEYAEYCGALSHRGQWMSLFCKRTCHCQNSQGEDQCCPSLIEDKSGDGNIDNDTKNEGISNVHEINVAKMLRLKTQMTVAVKEMKMKKKIHKLQFHLLLPILELRN